MAQTKEHLIPPSAAPRPEPPSEPGATGGRLVAVEIKRLISDADS